MKLCKGYYYLQSLPTFGRVVFLSPGSRRTRSRHPSFFIIGNRIHSRRRRGSHGHSISRNGCSWWLWRLLQGIGNNSVFCVANTIENKLGVHEFCYFFAQSLGNSSGVEAKALLAGTDRVNTIAVGALGGAAPKLCQCCMQSPVLCRVRKCLEIGR